MIEVQACNCHFHVMEAPEGQVPSEIITALDIPLSDLGVHVVGACLVHTTVFKDVGLVW